MIVFEIQADDDTRGRILFAVGPFYEDSVRLAVSIVPGPDRVNRVAFTFEAPADEHFVGFGERFNKVDQRGQDIVEHWSEEHEPL